MKRTDFSENECPVARAVGIVGDWWSLLIVRDALAGRRRFGEFQQHLGIAKNILADRLRKLVDAEVMETAPASDGSAFKDYVLTERGRGLLPVIVALGQWAGCKDAGFSLVENRKGKPAHLEFRADDGRRLSPDDVRLVPATS